MNHESLNASWPCSDAWHTGRNATDSDAATLYWQMHEGFVVLRLRGATLTPAKGSQESSLACRASAAQDFFALINESDGGVPIGLLGSDTARCDPYVKIKVNGAVCKSATVKESLKPVWNETKVMYAGEVSRDEIVLQVFDADLLLGNQELYAYTPDPLVGVGRLRVAELALAPRTWQELDVQLEPPAEATTAGDEENADNPYWAKIPREALVQTWPSIIKGSARGGTLRLEAQFVPLSAKGSSTETPTPETDDAGLPNEARDPEDAASSLGDSSEALEWGLLCRPSREVPVDQGSCNLQTPDFYPA